jgi:hypothetical protein
LEQAARGIEFALDKEANTGDKQTKQCLVNEIEQTYEKNLFIDGCGIAHPVDFLCDAAATAGVSQYRQHGIGDQVLG